VIGTGYLGLTHVVCLATSHAEAARFPICGTPS